MTAPARGRGRGRREWPAPAVGTVEMRLRGTVADIDAAIAMMRAAGLAVWQERAYSYPDRESGTFRRYVRADLRPGAGKATG